MSDVTAAIGHNQGPPLEPSDWEVALHPSVLRDQLDADYAALDARFRELLAGSQRFFETIREITDDTTHARAGALVVQLKGALKALEEARVVEKKPFDAASDAVQRWFKADRIDLLAKAARDVEAKRELYATKKADEARAAAKAEAARLAAEAARIQAEAEASMRPTQLEDAARAHAEADRARKTAEGNAASFSRVSGFGATSSLATKWKPELVDLSLVPAKYLMFDEVRAQADIDAGLRDNEDGTPAIPGVKIVAVTALRTRRS